MGSGFYTRSQLDLAIPNARNIDGDLAILLELQRQLLFDILGQLIDGRLHCLSILFESRPELCLLRLRHEFCDGERLLSRFTHDQRDAGSLGMARQVVCTPIGTSYRLDPAVACQEFGIDTVLGIVC